MFRFRRRGRHFVGKAAQKDQTMPHEVPCTGGGICLVRDGCENAGEAIGD